MFLYDKFVEKQNLAVRLKELTVPRAGTKEKQD
jgi:hypothetical protein